MINVNTAFAIQEIKKGFKSLNAREINLGIARALNHTAAKSKTASSKEIREYYSIKTRYIARAIKVDKANRQNLAAAVIATGRPLPLAAFPFRATKKGIAVKIRKEYTKLPGAFKATMASGHTGVFARGHYNKKDFAWRNKRIKKSGPDLPITELTTISIPGAFMHSNVINTLKQKVNKDFGPRLFHELSRIAEAKS